MPRPATPLSRAISIVPAFVLALTAHADPTDTERVFYDAALPDGTLQGGSTRLPFVEPELLQAADAPPAAWTTLLNNGPSSNRLDAVFLGDGYRNTDLANYNNHVQRAIDGLFAGIPFSHYKTYFNIHRVDVISNESGVDNDPSPGILRDTALDMGFWCEGIDRLLCVNTAKAYSYAANAPAADHLYALANSSRYGGAAYVSSRVVTFAAFHPDSSEIAIHESGHTLGNLADEYELGGPTNYTGPEPVEPNASRLTADLMESAGIKWHRWLREVGGVLDGPVDTYLGCRYSIFGIYRPSPNSKMRALHNPFNAPSVEAIILGIYQHVRPIDALSPPTSTHITPTSILTVTPLRPHDFSLTIRWFLDGQPLPGANAETLNLATLTIPALARTVTVEVRDDNPMVRDPDARAQLLTQSATWTFPPPPCPADANGDRVVNFLDLNIVLAFFGEPVVLGVLGDLNNDGIVDFLDLNIVLSYFGQIC